MRCCFWIQRGLLNIKLLFPPHDYSCPNILACGDIEICSAPTAEHIFKAEKLFIWRNATRRRPPANNWLEAPVSGPRSESGRMWAGAGLGLSGEGAAWVMHPKSRISRADDWKSWHRHLGIMKEHSGAKVFQEKARLRLLVRQGQVSLFPEEDSVTPSTEFKIDDVSIWTLYLLRELWRNSPGRWKYNWYCSFLPSHSSASHWKQSVSEDEKRSQKFSICPSSFMVEFQSGWLNQMSGSAVSVVTLKRDGPGLGSVYLELLSAWVSSAVCKVVFAVLERTFQLFPHTQTGTRTAGQDRNVTWNDSNDILPLTERRRLKITFTGVGQVKGLDSIIHTKMFMVFIQCILPACNFDVRRRLFCSESGFKVCGWAQEVNQTQPSQSSGTLNLSLLSVFSN